MKKAAFNSQIKVMLNKFDMTEHWYQELELFVSGGRKLF